MRISSNIMWYILCVASVTSDLASGTVLNITDAIVVRRPSLISKDRKTPSESNIQGSLLYITLGNGTLEK